MFKNANFNIIRFLLVFSFLNAGFYSYIGIVSPGGETYNSFYDHYANFPAWLSYLICKGAKGLLELGGYDTYQRTLNTLAIEGSRGVTIIWACLGFGVMSFWVAFVTAHRADWKYKLKWAATGIFLITGLNIVRIALIALATHYNWKAFKAVEPHLAFNIASYILIFGLAIWFISAYNRRIKIQKAKKISSPTSELVMN